MNFQGFYKDFKDFPLISLAEIRKLYPRFHSRRLHEWQERGYLKMLCPGYYFFPSEKLSDTQLFTFANRIYSPSYVSLESALSWHGVIPEAVYVVTSVSTKKTRAIETSSGNFFYRTIKKELFFGFDLCAGRFVFKMADVEKALLDFFYLNSHLNSAADIEGLRLNQSVLKEKLRPQILSSYLKVFSNQRLNQRLKLVLKEILDVKL